MREPDPAVQATRAGYLYLRHSWLVRLTHWLNVLSLTVLLMSGLMIFNAHPSLDWGKSSYTGRPSFLEITSQEASDGHAMGVTRVLGHEFDTTGLLGLSTGADGSPSELAFPRWITIPGYYSLAEARLWHFFFAWLLVINGVVYLLHAILSRHLKRDLTPTSRELKGIAASVRDHIRFRHPKGEDAKHYNVLQKLAYLVVIFVLLPLIVLAGWAMSPWLNSVWPGWVDVFGGRQSARAVHFIVAWLLVGFVAIHVFEVLISGVWNQLRSMVTGRFRITPAAAPAEPSKDMKANP